ncbi:hypothetical protein N7520_010974 [Penicillium odoratum]|uniref:uncharacterized protein n=1 Tax=Penicillium odoratum TaxID=1167516 RepID=UPI0025479A25|nr:uncharacterized protein N7520_010974 [Penicillium odoratum]KAJ5745792.1 hypothetical protein N7520_010974 [Penicillium odoratum]
MRPGLHKPGAFPLLALVIFSLLTLVPSLPSIYSLKLTDLTYYIGGSQVPLIQENVELPLDTHPSDRTPWILAAPSRSRLNRFSRPARIANGAPTISTETPSFGNRSRSSYHAESTFLFSRRARAFRTFFIQQLDDYQFLTPFSTGSVSTGASATRPDPTLTPNLAEPASIDDSNPTTAINNESLSSQPATDLGLQLSFTDMWQQACQTASGLWKLNSKLHRLIRWESEDAHSTKPADMPLIRYQKDAPPEEECTGVMLNKTLLPSNDQSTDAAGRPSAELQGSCMAVVIGLVAGIMWF